MHWPAKADNITPLTTIMATYFSKEGHAYYKGKLSELQRRAQSTGKEVGEEAGPNCDWHDNFGFEDARRRFELDSRRVKELSDSIREGRIVEAVEQSVRVAIGNTVQFLEDEDNEREVTIGAWGESSPDDGLVSYESPIGRALIGTEVGDTKTVSLGGKAKSIEVTEIFPPSHKYNRLIQKLFAEVEVGGQEPI